MSLTKVRAAAKLAANRNLLKVKKNSPTILMVAGIVGMVGTAVTASRATLKLEGVIDKMDERLAKSKELQRKIADGEVEFKEGYTPEDFKRAEVIIYAKGIVQVGKLYAPSVLLGVLSIGAIVGGHTIMDRRNVALAGAYAALDKTFARYRDRVVGAFGEEKEKELYVAATETTVTDPETGEVKSTFREQDGVSMYGRWFAKGNKNWESNNDSNFAFLRAQQNFANDLLKARGHVTLNDVYDSLGLPRTPAGQLVGWVWKKGTGDDYIDFGVFPDSGGRGIIRYNDMGENPEIFLDFNVDGVIYDLI
jgi:hypothetical protein